RYPGDHRPRGTAAGPDDGGRRVAPARQHGRWSGRGVELAVQAGADAADRIRYGAAARSEPAGNTDYRAVHGPADGHLGLYPGAAAGRRSHPAGYHSDGGNRAVGGNAAAGAAAGWSVSQTTARSMPDGSTGRRKRPVWECSQAAISSGVPVATMRPPPSPPSGPRSMMWSAVLMTSRLCSMTTTALPASR